VSSKELVYLASWFLSLTSGNTSESATVNSVSQTFVTLLKFE